MAQTKTSNPIQQRITYIGALWNEFAQNSSARLLRWLTDLDGTQLLTAFFELQNQEAGSDIPDLFLTFDVPFDTTPNYGFRLIEQFQVMYQEARSELLADGLDNSWSYLPPTHISSDIDAFSRCFESFLQHYKNNIVHLVLVLTPRSITSGEEWQNWWFQLLRTPLPDSLRITTIDHIETPYLDLLAEQYPTQVVTITPEFNMTSARREIIEQAGGSGPGMIFRRLFVELSDLAAQGESISFIHKAEAALRIAVQQQWPTLQVAVQMLIGAFHLNAGRPAESLPWYEAAKQAALEAEKLKDPAGSKLVLQAELGKGAALFAGKQYEDAAQVYEQTVPLAQRASDTLMVLESWRMAGYCYEISNDLDSAWRCGWSALESAKALDESILQNSTLPYVGQGLLRISSSNQRFQDYAEEIRKSMVNMVGPDWEGHLIRAEARL